MKAILDNNNNIILVAENAKEKVYIESIVNTKIIANTDSRNPATGRLDRILVLQPCPVDDPPKMPDSVQIQANPVDIDNKMAEIVENYKQVTDDLKKVVKRLDADFEWHSNNIKDLYAKYAYRQVKKKNLESQ